VETEQIVSVLCICVSTVLATAAVALLFSTLMNRAYAVIILAYGFFLIIWGLIPLMLLILVYIMSQGGARGPGTMMFLFNYLTATNPFVALGMIVFPDRPPFPVIPWPWLAGGQTVFAAMVLVFCAMIIRRMSRREGDSPAPTAPPPMPLESVIGETEGAPPPMPGVPVIPIGVQRTVSDNPVLWRELRRPLIGKRWQKVAATVSVVLIMLVIYGLLGGAGALDEPEMQIGYAFVFCALLTLLSCVISATAIAQEKESDTWTLLLASPLSSRQIVLGKLAGLFKRLMWPGILIAGHFLLFTLGGVINLVTFLIVIWLIFTTNTIWVTWGLYLSLRYSKVTMAAIISLLSPAMIYWLAAIVLGIGGAALSNDAEDWMEVVGLYAPYPYMLETIDRLNDNPQSYEYERQNDPQWNVRPLKDRSLEVAVLGRQRFAEFVVTVTCVGLGHLALSGTIVFLVIRRFDQIVGRARQSEGLPAAMLAGA
jgi:ABC-type transport system involved in multi-copper enzyme maturation permease subunit